MDLRQRFEPLRRVHGPALHHFVRDLSQLVLSPLRDALERVEFRRRRAVCADDLHWCAEILPRVSRTFALSIAALPDGLREAVLSAYLLCRVVDTIEDEADIAPETRERLFALFADTLSEPSQTVHEFERQVATVALGGESADGQLCRRAGAPLRLFRALPATQRRVIRPRVLVMLNGMREYCRRGDANGGLRMQSLDDLERYCYYVAGTVGRLLTDLFLQLTPNLDAERRGTVTRTAVSFGIGLQMVNIVKDVAEDFERKAVFLPGDLLAASGIPVPELLHPEHREAGLAVVRAACVRARTHLERAVTYTQTWPLPEGRPVREFCAVPLLLALATLQEVESGRDTLRAGEDPKISREAVAAILHEARLAIDDSERLRRLLG